MKISLPVVILGTQFLVPVNEQVPTLDVAASCRAAATAGMAADESYRNCMSDEHSARQELLRSWTSFAASDRSRCTTEASGDGLPSYVELLVCLQMSRDATRMQTTPLQGARKKK